MNRLSILPALALLLLAAPATRAQTATGSKATAPAPTSTDLVIICKQLPGYPLTTCVACDKPLPPVPVEYVHDARLYRICASACSAAVDANVPGMGKKIDAAVVTKQKAAYPLKVSAVSDKPLEATAVDHVYGTRLVRLANKDEIVLFQKEPGTAMAKIDKGYVDAQIAAYAPKACPVGKEEIGADAVNYIWGTKLVRFCCRKCVSTMEADPVKYAPVLSAL